MDGHYGQQYGSGTYRPPPYVMLQEQNGSTNHGLQPPPCRRNLPVYHSKKRRRGCGSVCGCIFWCCCFLFLFLILLLAGLVYAYISLDPKPPSYSVDHMGVSAFDLGKDFSLHTEFVVDVRAENPNQNIGIAYGKDSKIAVMFKDSVLCSGKLPTFYQGHGNTTVIRVVLKGDSTFGSGLHEALTESEKSSSIPLDIFVEVPVALRAWATIDTEEIVVLVNCHLVVDSLKANKKVSIKSKDYKVNVKF